MASDTSGVSKGFVTLTKFLNSSSGCDEVVINGACLAFAVIVNIDHQLVIKLQTYWHDVALQQIRGLDERHNILVLKYQKKGTSAHLKFPGASTTFLHPTPVFLSKSTGRHAHLAHTSSTYLTTEKENRKHETQAAPLYWSVIFAI